MSDPNGTNERWQIPPIPHERELQRVAAKLRSLSLEEGFQVLVRAGIYTPEGELTEPYANDEPSACRPTD